MMKIIAIDHGNSAVKTVNHEFPAGLADAQGIADETVEYQGRQYALSSRRIPYQRDKTAKQDYFILTLFALARELQGPENPEDSIVLAVGLPPAHYKALRHDFEAYFTAQAPLCFKYNGHQMVIRIEQVMVFPQGFAAAATRLAELKEAPQVFAIDIGGMTVDTLLLRAGKPDMAYTLSLEYGTNKLCNSIMAALSAQLGVNTRQEQVTAVLRGEGTMLDDEAQALITAHAQAFTDRLLGDLCEREIDIRTTPAMFIGGGSLLLRPFIERSSMAKRVTFIEDTHANAIGYERLARARLMQA